MASNARTKRSFAETGPSSPVVDSVRVDQVTPGAKAGMNVRLILAILVAFIMLIPVFWMASTAIKSRPDATARRPRSFSPPPGIGFIGLFANRTQLSAGALATQKRRGPT